MKERIEKIASEVYGAEGVEFSEIAIHKLNKLQADNNSSELGVCMVKTHLSLSDDPKQKCVPEHWNLHVRDIMFFGGAGFVVPIAGSITLMPGTGSNPSFRRIDVDTDTGKVKGIF